MIAGFDDWAAQAQIVEHGAFDQLSGCIIGIEAEHYLGNILTSPATREPLLPALGGIPFLIESRISENIEELRKHNITPFFVFSGLSFNGQDNKLRAAIEHSKNIGHAWDLYQRSDPDRAVAEFGAAGTFDVDHIYRHVQSYFHKIGIDFLVAPYSACAELAFIEGSDKCQAVCGPSEILMFDVEQVITSIDFANQQFHWVTRRTCIEALAVGSTRLFIDACLLAGSTFLPTLPHLDTEVPSKVPKIQAAADLIKRSGLDGNALCIQYQDDPNMQSLNYLDRYRRTVMSIRHHIVLTADGEIQFLDRENAPGDSNTFTGQRLPDELYFYLSRGVVAPRLLTWRSTGEIVESPPLDGGVSATYQTLVRDKLADTRTVTLSLLSQALHRFFQHQDITLRTWFNPGESQTLDIRGTTDPRRTVADWNVRSSQLSKAGVTPTLGSALASLRDQDFAKTTLTRKVNGFEPLKSKDEITCNTIWRYLRLRGYTTSDHTLSKLGESLLKALEKAGSPELEEPVLLAIELLRLKLLNSDSMFQAPPYHGAPFRGSPSDQQNTLLVSRVAALGTLKHKEIGYTGPLSRHLLAYASLIKNVRETQRDLVEVCLATLLMDGNFVRDREEKDYSDIAFSLPFLHHHDCALGIAVKHYLDELAAQPDPTTVEARESIKTKGAKSWFPHAVDFHGNLDEAFRIWDAVCVAVQSAPDDLLTGSEKRHWAQVDAWLKDRR